jgi:2-oxoisovalerate dehydrogenase E2 component (dihydrolipoyl transacylase)
MGEYVIKLPDVGEGVAEAELVEWLVKEGANVREDEVLAAVMTDKATVEIPSPVEGKVMWLGAKIGEIVAVGSPIIRLEVDGEGNVKPGAAKEAKVSTPKAEEKPKEKAVGANGAAARVEARTTPPSSPAKAGVQDEVKTGSPLARGRSESGQASAAPRKEGEKPLASPAVRKRALDAGLDLRRVAGSGPAGRITHDDLDRHFDGGASAGVARGRAPDISVKEIPVIGLRRKIAEKMALSASRIPHITYVDEVDVTGLEELRLKLNKEKRDDQPKLTILPFLMRAMARAIAEQPQLNARFDDEAGIVHQYGGMHMGVAAQTDNGLVVPVVKHVEARGLWDCAAELARLAEGARKGSLSREELTGSTITITSLGAMGGIVTTPVINHPEVAILGVHKIVRRPVCRGDAIVPRDIMYLSISLDHRIVDGAVGAYFMNDVVARLENPGLLLLDMA